MSLIELKKYQFKKGELNDNFIKKLNKNDLFSFHCRDFIKYLGFKRCDKKFREKFYQFLDFHKIKFAIASSPLDEDRIYNILNAEKIVKENLDKPLSPNGMTWRKLYNYCLSQKDCIKTFDAMVEDQIDILRNTYSIRITEDKELSGGFNSGCWLILIKE